MTDSEQKPIKQKVVLDLDDFSVTSPNFEYILKLKEHYPNLKITLFTIPLDKFILSGKIKMDTYMRWAEMIHAYSDWLEIAVHGFTHDKPEMVVPYKQAKDTLKAAERMFSKIKFFEKRRFWGNKWKKYYPNIPYKKIFKAAGWMMSDDAYKAARDMGYVVGVDRNQPTPQIDGLETYKFNWSIDEPFPKEYPIMKAHGHMYATPAVQNDILTCFENLLTIPSDVEFLTISEFLQWQDQERKKN